MHFKQRTVTGPINCSGVGIHSGKKVNLIIKPAPINHGIKFKRIDLPDSPSISAHFNMVVDTSLATVIGYNGFIVSTIEHLMATFAGLSIDNALVEIDGYEMAAGTKEQAGQRCFFVVKEPIELKENGKFVGIYPESSFKITCDIDYDHPLVKKQSYTIELCDEVFEREICSARTFGFLHEYEEMKSFGLARGGSLDNVIGFRPY
jgi:UDP-3-O-[3-hydroxymyristoyl] N-acetylglucosamine deacetylase